MTTPTSTETSGERSGGVTVSTAAGGFRTVILTHDADGGSRPTAVSDAPEATGGAGEGPTPTELLLASIAACKAMTARSYAKRKGFPLEDVRVHATIDESGETPRIDATVELGGDLDDDQRERLLAIMERCHVQKIVAAGPSVESRFLAPSNP